MFLLFLGTQSWYRVKRRPRTVDLLQQGMLLFILVDVRKMTLTNRYTENKQNLRNYHQLEDPLLLIFIWRPWRIGEYPGIRSNATATAKVFQLYEWWF